MIKLKFYLAYADMYSMMDSPIENIINKVYEDPNYEIEQSLGISEEQFMEDFVLLYNKLKEEDLLEDVKEIIKDNLLMGLYSSPKSIVTEWELLY